MFEVPAASKKCLLEDVHKDILVVGEYDISDDYDMQIDLEVCGTTRWLWPRAPAAAAIEFDYATENAAP